MLSQSTFCNKSDSIGKHSSQGYHPTLDEEINHDSKPFMHFPFEEKIPFRESHYENSVPSRD